MTRATAARARAIRATALPSCATTPRCALTAHHFRAPIVLNTATLCVQVFRFCRSKCHNTFKNKYNPRKLKWTKAFRRAAGKEMAVDSTFDFERLRNRPVKYDRELMKKTVRTMERVQAIKEKREERFWAKRMAPNKEVQKARDLAEVEQGLDLIISPLVSQDEQKVAKQERAKAKAKVAAKA